MDFDDFKITHSETIMYYQIIESDLKIIYYLMSDSHSNKDFSKIENMTLGQIINALKELDYSSDNSLISKEDYNYLTQIKENRNYWAHNNFLDFVYNDDFLTSEAYIKQCNKLKKDHNRVEKVYKNLEQIRLSFYKNIKNKKG